MKKTLHYIPHFLIACICIVFIRNLPTPLQGMHKVRQADTLMTGVIYCFESAPFLEPRIAFRGDMPKGIVRGELPVFSYLTSLPCKITGQWSDIFPKVLTYFFFFFGLFLWVKFLFPDSKAKRKMYFLLSLSVSAVLTYLLIPIPDAMVFFVFSLAATVLKRPGEKSIVRFWQTVLALALITLGFVVRPYFVFLIPYLFLVAKDRRYIYSLIPAAVAYFWWYKTVVPDSDILNYYYTGMPSFVQMAREFLPSLATGLFYIIRDQVSIFGLIFLYYGLRLKPLIALYGLSVLLVMYFMRGSHLNAHQYYVLALTFIALHLMTEGAFCISDGKRTLILSLMLLNLIVSDQHHWHRPDVDYLAVRKLAADKTVFSDRICTKNFGLSEGFYYALRTGWSDKWSDLPTDTFPPVRAKDPNLVYECPSGTLTIDRNAFLVNRSGR